MPHLLTFRGLHCVGQKICEGDRDGQLDPITDFPGSLGMLYMSCEGRRRVGVPIKWNKVFYLI